jgi:hypothetical protein
VAEGNAGTGRVPDVAASSAEVDTA